MTLADPVVRVDPGHGDARTEIRIGGQRVAPNTPVVLRAPPPLAWVGDGEADSGTGYVISKLGVDRRVPVVKATVDLEIDHTFRGDLVVDLVTPGGEHLRVTEGSGGENDLRGSFTVELPDGLESAGDWHLVVGDRAGLDIGTLDAWKLTLEPAADGAKIVTQASDLPRFIPDAPDAGGDSGHTLIEVAPVPVRTLAARLGRVVASAEKGFHRLEIDAAPKLSQLPRKASVVFVIDRSRSVSEEALGAQLRIIEAYRSHVPDASVEIVAFDRKARRVLGEFTGADKFASALASAQTAGKLGLGNGSALEEGLALAAELLAGRTGPTRIVALTDARLRTRFSNKLADTCLAAAPGSTVTHVVIPEDEGYAFIRRDDTHALAPIAAVHRGVLFMAGAPADDKTVAKEMLGLVRPIAIDHFKISGMDLKEAGQVPEVLREGDGYRAMLATPDPTRRVVLSGKLWATPVRRVVTNNERFDIATAAFVFSEDEHHELSPEEMRVVAYRGRAVSPVTSYLATEPGVRPSTDGLEEFGLGGLGLVGTGAGGGGAGSGSIGMSVPTIASLLAKDLERCVQAHVAMGGYQLTLAVETTASEVVDVEAKAASHAPLRECMVEATWALDWAPVAGPSASCIRSRSPAEAQDPGPAPASPSIDVLVHARGAGTRRVVFASSNHVTGYYKQSETITADHPPRPDGMYGVSKAFGEDLSRFYFDRHGIETACVRIGSSFPEPVDRRMLASWLSHGDLYRLVTACLTTPMLGHTIVFGMSDNPVSWWDNARARHVGYRPQDSSERFREALFARTPTPDPTDPAAVFQGGGFVRMGPFD